MFLNNTYEEYEGKPVAISGVSNGPVGGARMAEQLKLVLSAFQMMIVD
ncbi:MAG: NAD(P)H-dependent oxidoreductase [Candidatus Nomurabacteria bacterium]|nr:NAD(P)H-dependent oxidoreductase [Candidatus Nomurabacteria bacterium]